MKKIKKASSFVFWLLRPFFRLALRCKYRYKFLKKSSKGIRRPCLILYNHQTMFDQFAVGLGFKFGINFVASDTLFRHGLGSWLMRALARPIPIAKGSNDTLSVLQIMRVIKSGGSVAIAPSGNRSFFGDECTIDPSIGKLAKKLGVPVVLVQFRGGFNTKPRWRKKPAKGRMTGEVTRVIAPEELSALSAEEAFAAISAELSFDEFAWNRAAQVGFRGKHKAEYLEGVLFWCPHCHDLHGMRSKGNDFFCTRCGLRVRIGKTGFFEAVNGGARQPQAVPPDTILAWSKLQLDYIKQFDFAPFTDRPAFSDNGVRFLRAQRAKRETLLGVGEIALYADRLVVCDRVFPLSEIRDMAVGVSKMNIYTDTESFSVAAPYDVNLLKYMVCGYKIKNAAAERGEEYYGY